MVSKNEEVAFIPVSGCDPDSGVHYYHLEPEFYRFNVLLHKPLTNYNDAQKDFYRFVLAYFANAEK